MATHRATRSPLGPVLLFIVLALVVGGLLRAQIIHWPVRAAHLGMGAPSVALHLAGKEAPVSLADFKNGFASVIDPALPAVVNISSTKMVKQQNNMPGLFNDPFFRQFFGDQQPPSNAPQMEREYSLGSGVIVNSDGYILTNNHVVADAQDVEVFTQDRKKYKAKVIGTDARTDIAVVKVEASGLPVVTIGDSSQLKVGDMVFAIGDPFGIGETATTGIVSATGRALGQAIEHYENFIQTDAAINPGNSGGALIELHGNLIGINTAILSGGGGNQGIGFAIPINMARNVMDQIVEHGKVIRGYLGVTIQSVDPDMAKAFGLSSGRGALIGDVTPDGPGSKAGLQRGDIVLTLNGEDVNSSDDLSLRISQMAPGSVAHLKIFRSGQNKDVDVTLGEYPEKGSAAQPNEKAPAILQGLQVENLTRSIARQLNLPLATTGVVVTQVDPSSAAAMAGLQQGDVIQEVNHKPVQNTEQFQQAVSAAGDQTLLLLVNREGTTHYAILQPQ
jgi:serine protease Do